VRSLFCWSVLGNHAFRLRSERKHSGWRRGGERERRFIRRRDDAGSAGSGAAGFQSGGAAGASAGTNGNTSARFGGCEQWRGRRRWRLRQRSDRRRFHGVANSVSFTNSDPWLSQHHDQITAMNPNVLVLNYANKCGANGAKACDPTYLGTLIDEHVKAFQWASRYHGYTNPNAPAFLIQGR